MAQTANTHTADAKAEIPQCDRRGERVASLRISEMHVFMRVLRLRIYRPSIYVLYKSGIIEEERQTLVN
jgi:hypothetical protein